MSCFPIEEESILDPFFGYDITPEAFAKLASFVISAPSEQLHDILYTQSTSEMATLLSRTSLEASRYTPTKKIITKCKWAVAFLQNQPDFNKKVVIPLALMYIIKYRLHTNDTHLHAMPEVFLAVALRLANTWTSDIRTKGLKLKNWSSILWTDLDEMKEAQSQLLAALDYGLGVKIWQLEDFVGRMQRVWIVLESTV
jgi:hypothetical protein